MTKDQPELSAELQIELDDCAYFIDDWYGGTGAPKQQMKEFIMKFAEKYATLKSEQAVKDERAKMLSWLGRWRDHIEPEAVSLLQDICEVPKVNQGNS